MTHLNVLPRLNPHLQTIGVATEDSIGDEHTVPAHSLFGPARFDLAAKHIYARHRKLGVASQWASSLYDAHILAFNGGREGDASGKEGCEAFRKAFDHILDITATTGLDRRRSVVPVGSNGTIIDGAHRVVASLLYERAVATVDVDFRAQPFDYEFFMKRGLGETWCDAIAMEYCRLRQNARALLVFPSASGPMSAVRSIIREHTGVAYEKKVWLNDRGAVNLTRQLYRDEPWVGTIGNGFAGARAKARACFGRRAPLHVFIVEGEGATTADIKGKIRDLFQIGNNSVHGTDTHDETLTVAQLIFNRNSIHNLNYARLQECPRFARHFELFSTWIQDSGHDPEHFCIDGSGTLAAYGIRDAYDLDFLHHDPEMVAPAHSFLASHNSEILHHEYSRDALIWNPEFHFYHGGLKVVSLDAIARMKSRRREGKDMRDVTLIHAQVAQNRLARWTLTRRAFAMGITNGLRETTHRSAGRLRRAIGRMMRVARRYASHA